ncbi:MAG: hypothetical protein ABR512_15885 [Desulfopila sp.]
MITTVTDRRYLVMAGLPKGHNTSIYLKSHDVAKKWFQDQITIKPEEQLLLMKNLNKDTEGKASHPLVLPYNQRYLTVNDVIEIYKNFNTELKTWFRKNHINIELNIVT